jgi:hypothetical protein
MRTDIFASQSKTCLEVANDLVEKMNSPFCEDDDTKISWIKGALEEAAQNAQRAEESRIERFIGSRTRQQILKLWEMTKFKTGVRKK